MVLREECAVPEIHDGLPKFNNEPPEELQLELHPAALPNSHPGEGAENLLDSDYRHSDHQPKTHHGIHEEISAVVCYPLAKCFPHCSPVVPPQADQSPPLPANTPMGNNSGQREKKPGHAREIQDFKKGVGEFFDKLICKQKVLPPSITAQHYELHKNIALQRASSSTLPTSSGKPALLLPRVGDKAKRGGAAKEQAEATSGEELRAYQEKGEFVLKRNADSETIKRQQKELNGLGKPLGYPKRRNKFSRDDVLSLAGDDRKDLISASRKICHNLSLKRNRTAVCKLIKRWTFFRSR
ncbi:hypothetical protein QYE76_000603 [Lolium multiflorum]|uniref:Uncharacterized protein n=1 Tax=Lolium multiflorum TaxID=4521 RepID=A0AAD8RJH4_LOLMU|nr:hypothetical protein QYE76_000603 [Lolium multiflorum]